MKPLALSWPQRLALSALVGGLAAVASHWQWFWQQDEAVYDAYVGAWDYPPDPRLLIVAIDDNSLQQIGGGNVLQGTVLTGNTNFVNNMTQLNVVMNNNGLNNGALNCNLDQLKALRTLGY